MANSMTHTETNPHIKFTFPSWNEKLIFFVVRFCKSSLKQFDFGVVNSLHFLFWSFPTNEDKNSHLCNQCEIHFRLCEIYFTNKKIRKFLEKKWHKISYISVYFFKSNIDLIFLIHARKTQKNVDLVNWRS